MHDVKVQIRCQRCGTQMELKDPGPDDPWPPQQFWKCPECGRNFWTTYPPPKKPKPAAPPKPPAAATPSSPTAPAAGAEGSPAPTESAKPPASEPPAGPKTG